MQPTRWIALAVALTGCAVAYGIHLFSQPEAEQGHTVASPDMKKTSPRFAPVADLGSPSRQRSTPRSSAVGSMKSSPQAAPKVARMIVGAPIPSHGPVQSEAKWRSHAAQVEMEANHELERLTTLLDLDASQQDQVFSRLARQSDHWLAGMGTARQATTAQPNPTQIETNPTSPSVSASASSSRSAGLGSEPQSIADVLTPAQLEVLVDEEWERQAWWEEILPQLLPPISPEPQVVTAAPPAEQAPATKAFEETSTTLGEE
jgi:hypothetical protein